MRQDPKWNAYAPKPNVKRFEAFLNLVREDVYRCFFG